MLTEIEPLVRGIDNDCIFSQTGFVEVAQEATHIVVNRCDRSQVVLDVPLVLPTHQIAPF